MGAVTLNEADMVLATAIGTRRHIENLLSKRRPAHNLENGADWQIHVEGAAGEIALAKWLDRYWNGNLGNHKAADVGQHEVRTSTYPNACLLIHDSDADDRKFILVTGKTPDFILRGWIWGRDGKKPEYWPGPNVKRPCYAVPQDVLYAMPPRKV